MVFRDVHLRRRHWLALGLRVWVVTILLVGTLVSSLGQMSSHGIAAVAAVQHDSDAAHGHSHDDGEPDASWAVGDPAHVHHNNADHTHDKAHALPVTLSIASPPVPVLHPLAHPLAPGHLVFRLDRPPMA